MSRRRGEFEHRTSIFEGAFRAWSSLGGREPEELETKTLAELDPLLHPIDNDKRSVDGKGHKNVGKNSDDEDDKDDKPDKDSGDNLIDENRRLYPYEPLPRSGLAHPFVQAILSPWLGPDAEQDAIQLGLTTLRTWWQHRRKGESGSAITVLGTERMRGVVEGYTRHFFNLAHSFVTNDGEQPPRTLMFKMKDLEKRRMRRQKKRGRDDLSSDKQHMPNPLSDPPPSQLLSLGHAAAGANTLPRLELPIGVNDSVGDESSNNPLERLHAAQRRQLAASGIKPQVRPAAAAVMEKVMGTTTTLSSALDSHQNNAAASHDSMDTPIDKVKLLANQINLLRNHNNSISKNNSCINNQHNNNNKRQSLSSLSKSLLPLHNSVSHTQASSPLPNHSKNNNSLNNLTLASTNSLSRPSSGSNNTRTGPPAVEPPNIYENSSDSSIPVIYVSSSTGEIQFCMSVEGITCDHCVKIVETVLRGCNFSNSGSPIRGLLDAAADVTLKKCLVKIDRIANAKRISQECSRNLAMVGYTAHAREMRPWYGSDIDTLGKATLAVACHDTTDSIFDWSCPCTCPDNGIRPDCPRHGQMSNLVFQAFDVREQKINEYLRGNNNNLDGYPNNNNFNNGHSSTYSRNDNYSNSSKYSHQSSSIGGSCTNSSHNTSSSVNTDNHHSSTSGSASGSGSGPHNNDDEPKHVVNPPPPRRIPMRRRSSILRSSMRNSLGSIYSFPSRAMSGLSALSIDWENMSDFDVNVDHSAHINPNGNPNSPINPPQPQSRRSSLLLTKHNDDDGDSKDGIMEGCAMMRGGPCTCGPTCVCVGCPIHDRPGDHSTQSSTSTLPTANLHGGGGGERIGTGGVGRAVHRRSSLRMGDTRGDGSSNQNMTVSFSV